MSTALISNEPLHLPPLLNQRHSGNSAVQETAFWFTSRQIWSVLLRELLIVPRVGIVGLLSPNQPLGPQLAKEKRLSSDRIERPYSQREALEETWCSPEIVPFKPDQFFSLI